jgi:hypothetical protein
MYLVSLAAQLSVERAAGLHALYGKLRCRTRRWPLLSLSLAFNPCHSQVDTYWGTSLPIYRASLRARTLPTSPCNGKRTIILFVDDLYFY